MKRSVWISGGKYLHSLPVKWARKIKEEYNGEIDEIQVDDKILITPPYDPARRLTLRITPNLENRAELKMKIVSAYLEGYNIVEIPTTSQLSSELKAEIHSFVPKTIGDFDPYNMVYRLSFLDQPHDIRIEKAFEDSRRFFNFLKNYVEESFRLFPDKEKIQANLTDAKEYERKFDEMVFTLRRYLNKALSYVGIYEIMGVGNDRDAIHHSSILEYYERLADLQVEIIERMKKMIGRKEYSIPDNIKLYPFRSYYEEAYSTIEASFAALQDAYKGLELINAKLSGWKGYGNLLERKEEVKNFIRKQEEPLFIRDLTILEGKTGAIPYISCNICELAWNKDRKALVGPPTAE